MFGNKVKKDPRFVNTLNELSKDSELMMVYVDTETGVQYLFARPGGDAGGMTVLVDENGKPLINETYRRKKEQ